MKNSNLIMTCVMMSLALTGCKQEEDGGKLVKEDKAIADSVEAAITAMAGASDEEADEEIATYERTKLENLLHKFNPIQSAFADVCSGRAMGQNCVNGVKEINYYDCNIGLTKQTLSGVVALTYTDDIECNIDDDYETVTRTYDVTRTTGWGAKVRTFSSEHTDFEGSTFSGGGMMEKVPTGYELNILGKHKTRTGAAGRARLDISLKTGSPISFNQLRRDGRVVDGGSMEISHNLAKYKVILEPQALTYSNTCCYPVSGTMNVSYSGRVEGSGKVVFNSCGSATVSNGEKKYNIEFYSCE